MKNIILIILLMFVSVYPQSGFYSDSLFVRGGLWFTTDSATVTPGLAFIGFDSSLIHILDFAAYIDSTRKGLMGYAALDSLLSPTQFYKNTLWYVRQAGLDSLGDFVPKIRGRGLYETVGDTIVLDLQTDSGLILRNAGIALGTPTTITTLTTNAVSGSTHSHALTETGDIEGVTAGAGLSGTATSGTATIVVNAGLGIQTTNDSVAVKLRTDSGLSKLEAGLAMGTPTTLTAATSNAVTGASHTHAITGFLTAETGDISSVTAGTGLTGGGTTGDVTINAVASTGLDTVADSIKVKLAASSGLLSKTAGLSLDGTDARNYNWTNETHNLLTTGTGSFGSDLYLTVNNKNIYGKLTSAANSRMMGIGSDDKLYIGATSGIGEIRLYSGNGTANMVLSSGNVVTFNGSTSGISHTDLSNLNSASYTHLTATNATDLTDGGNTTLHTHSIYLTGNQTITLSGDITGSGTTAITTTIADNSVDGTDIALGSDAQGDIMYYDGTNWARLGQSTSGYLLKTQGAAANPAWANITDYESALEGVLDRSDLQGTQSSSTLSDMEEYVEDYIGGMVTGNTETGIAVTYEDSDGTLDFVVSESGDIESVTAGAGLTGGGTTGAVTLDVIASTGLATVADSVKVKLAASSGLLSKVAGMSLDGTDARNYNWTNETHNLLTTGSITSGVGGYIVTGVGSWTGSTLARAVDTGASYILGGTAWNQGSGLEYFGGEHATTPGRVKIWYGSQVDDLTFTDFYLARKDNGAEITVLRADINGDITLYDALTTTGVISAGSIGAGTTWNGNQVDFSSYVNATVSYPLQESGDNIQFNYDNADFTLMYSSTLALKDGGIDTNEVLDSEFYDYIADHSAWITGWNIASAQIRNFAGSYYASEDVVNYSGVYIFDDESTNDDRLYYQITVPGDYDEGGDLYIAAMWEGQDATAGNVRWQLGRQWADIGEAFPNDSTLYVNDANITTGTKYLNIAYFAQINGAGYKVNSVIKGMLARNSSNVDDTYTSKDAYLHDIILIYPVDRAAGMRNYNAK